MAQVTKPRKKDGDIDSQLLYCYLRETLPSCQTVQLFASSSVSAQAPIHDLYVSMPTNITIDLRVENGKILKIIEQTITQEDYAFKNYMRNPDFTPVEYDQEKVKKIINILSQNVQTGKEYFYPERLERPLVISPPWTDGIKDNYWVLSVGDIVSLYDKVVLLGGPGSGKSTSLRYLAARLIDNYLGNPYISDELLSNYLFEEKYIPIYVEIRDFSKWLSNNQRTIINLQELKEYIYSQFKNQQLADSSEAFWTELKSHNVIFLFDGLDEAFSPSDAYQITRQKLRGLTAQLTSVFSTMKILFSSRIGEYVDYQLADYKMVKLVPMHRYKSRELVQKIYKYYDIPFDESRIACFLTEMQDRNLKEDISGNPLLLSLIVAIAMNTPGDCFSLPKQKSHILYEGIKLFIDRWYINEERPDFFKKYNDDEILIKLKQFAYKTNENGVIDVRELMSFMQADYENANDILDYLLKRAGLIVKKGNDYEFAHKSFRSYLAASYIVESMECTKYLTTDNKYRFKRQREESLLVIDILFDTIKSLESNDGPVSKLWSIITLLVYTKTHDEWDIWLAGIILSRREYLLLRVDYPLKETVLAQLKKLLLDVFQQEGDFSNQDLDTAKRLQCGEILGKLGDLRDGVNVENGVPQITWCEVQGGSFVYGIEPNNQSTVRETAWGRNCIFKRELPARTICVDGFYISKYPITVRQYSAFVEASNGYYSPEWYQWSNVAKAFYNNIVDNQQFSFPKENQIENYPATNISFIEAIAFCKWISNTTGDAIRLPSDVEWEYVAKQNKTIFTWGDQFDKNKCNSLSSGIGHICPVGSFATNQNGNVPVDLCGNTWEWTQSFFTETHENDYKNAIINVDSNEGIQDYYLVADRGGCYLNGPNCLRVSFRGRDPITSKADRYGFRIVKETKPFAGEIYNTPPVNQEFKTADGRIQERSGYGAEIQIGDNIRIWYSVSKNGVFLQKGTCDLKLGSQKIHQRIEKMLYNKRVAAYFNIELSGIECFGNKTYCNVEPSDTLEFDISVMDVFD